MTELLKNLASKMLMPSIYLFSRQFSMQCLKQLSYMVKHRRPACYGIITLLLSLATHATPINTTPTMNINLQSANQQFEQIKVNLSVEHVNLTDLEAAMDRLNNLNDQAEHCITDAQKKIDGLNELSNQSTSIAKTKKQSVDLAYLEKQINNLSSQQAECRLFSIRVKEALDAYRATSVQLVKKVALTRDSALWSNIQNVFQQNLPTTFLTPAYQVITNLLPPSLLGFSTLGFSLLIAILLLKQFQKSSFSHHLRRIKLLRLRYILLLSALLSSGLLFLYQVILVLMQTHSSSVLMIPGILFAYLFSLTMVVLIFKLRQSNGYFLLHALDYNFFRHISISILSFYALGIMGSALLTQSHADNAFSQLCQSIYLLSIIATSLYFTHYFCRIHRHNAFVKHHQRLIQWVVLIWLTVCAILEIEGYHLLASHFTLSSLLAFAIAFITIVIALGIQELYLALYERPRLNQWMMHYIGYKKDQIFIEFLILKTILQIIAAYIGIYLIGESIDFAAIYIESLHADLLNGIHFASVIIYPARIVTGVIIFCLLFLICRGISTAIIRHHQFEGEEETQVAFASILTYAGFTLALIAGLIIAGFNFTGLAIVAGALSVGIGLGLQSVVNNFVSGLILLLEKPIRPGDRISVDGAEGFVKKIRIRSTQIITPSREDIIIPNSDLITRRVTNYMFSDKNCRLYCEIGVAYGSDTKLVRDTLLNIANLHDDVVKTGRFKPMVLFRSFGESNLIFQLWCLIKDVNKKLTVQSDLNFAIDEAFRKHNITMAYAQRELHLNWTEALSDLLKKEKNSINLERSVES